MRRRDFVGRLGVAAAWPFAARGQQPESMRSVGVLIFSAENDPVSATRTEALRDGLQKLGWTEGANLKIEYRFGAADSARLNSYAEELVRLSPDVIVAGAAPATRAVQRLTQTIPIVFVEATNEVGYGLIGDLALSANATGITNLYLAIGTRWLELLKEAAPRIVRVALLFNPEFDSRSYLAAIGTAADAYHVKAIRTPARNAEEIEHSIGTFAAKPNGGLLVVPPSPAFANVALIFRLAAKYGLPAIYPTRGFAGAGGLMAYGPNSADLFRESASYVVGPTRKRRPPARRVRLLR